MKLAYACVDCLVIAGLFIGVAILVEKVDRYAQDSVNAAKKEAKRQADLSPDEYLALMREKAKEAGIKQRKSK